MWTRPKRADRSAAGIGQQRVRHALLGNRTGADQPVLGLKKYLEIRREVVCDQRGNADAKIDKIPGRSSSATRRAMMIWASMRHPCVDEVIHQRRGRHDMVGRDHADRHNMLRVTMTVSAAMAMMGLKLRAVSA